MKPDCAANSGANEDRDRTNNDCFLLGRQFMAHETNIKRGRRKGRGRAEERQRETGYMYIAVMKSENNPHEAATATAAENKFE